MANKLPPATAGMTFLPPQAGHPALHGKENRQDHLPCVGAFQRNQHRNHGGQNQADDPKRSSANDGG